jgi:uncharacterized protein YhdP
MRSTCTTIIKYCLWTLAGLVVLLLSLGGLLLWRLAAGPMSVNFLTPYLEAALAASFSGRQIAVQDSVLVWHRQVNRLEFQARHVRVMADDRTTVATLPIVDVTLNLKALVRGTVALKSINLEGVRVSLVHAEDGTFRLGATPEATVPPLSTEADSAKGSSALDQYSQVIADIAKSLVAEADPAQPLASLEEVRITRGVLVVHDQRLGKTWRATQAALSIQRSKDGMIGRAQLTFALQDTPARLEGILAYYRTTNKLSLEFTFTQLQPSALAAVVPALEGLVGVDVPVSGTVSLTLNAQAQIDTVHFELSSEAGQIAFPAIFAEPLQVAGLMARGRVEGAGAITYLDTATITLGSAKTPGPRLWLQGTVENHNGDLTLAGEVKLSDLPFADFKQYWPQGANHPARDWLQEYLPLGRVDALQANVVGTLPQDKSRGVQVESLHGTLQAQVTHPHTPTRVNATAAYNAAQSATTLEVAFTDLHPNTLAARVPALHGLIGIDVPLAGRVVARLDRQGTLQDARAEITGKPGTVSDPTLFPESFQVSSITAQASFNQSEQSVTLHTATVMLGPPAASGPRLEVSGVMQGVGDNTRLHVQVSLHALPMPQLKSYWPMGVSANARTWLTNNLAAGAVEEARADLRFRLPGGSLHTMKLEDLQGTLRYRNLEVHYLRPLPPATEVSGSASFSQQGFRIKIDSGHVTTMQFTTGTVDITGLDEGRDAIAIAVGIHTPLRTVLTLLDHPSLHLLSDLQGGITPHTTDGQATAELGFAFPLRGVIDFSKVDITARGSLEKVSLQHVVLGQNVENGAFKLVLDKSGMTLNGTAEVATIPLTLEWQEAFVKKADWKSQFRAVVPQLELFQLEKFGLYLPDYVTGPLAVTVSARLGPQGIGQVDAVANLQRAVLTLPFLGWRKPADEPGEARGTVHLNPAQGYRGSVVLAAPTLKTRGTFQWRHNAEMPFWLNLRDVVAGNTRVDNVSLEYSDTKLNVVVGAGDVDAQPLLRSRAPQESAPDAGATANVSPPAAEQAGLHVHIQAPELRRVYFADSRYLQNVKATLARAPNGWTFIDIGGQVPAALVQPSRAEKNDLQEGKTLLPRTIQVLFNPAEQRPEALWVQMNDLGAVLRAMNLHDGMIGGQVQIDGHTLSASPGGPLHGRLEIKDFTMQQAPFLARILAAASLPGILNMLQHDGLAFTKLSGDFELADGIITMKQLRTHGGALGLTAKGTVDLKASSLNLKGTVIPFYGLNTLLSRIPVVGSLLSGGKGEGLFAAAYRLTGKFADPQVAVNPASVLTPGFLRGIFDLFEGSNNDVDIEQQLPAPPPQETSP